VAVARDFRENVFAAMMDTVNAIKLLGVRNKTEAWNRLRLLSRESGIFSQSNSALAICWKTRLYRLLKNVPDARLPKS